jgi:S1-C subfamily serine protease
VIAVESGEAPTLRFDPSVEPQQGVAILGFPEDGPFDVQTARVRSQQRLRSPNIYGDGAVIRDVLSLRGTVRPGNSGGPVLSSAGDVVGLVFAASLTDSETGYALTSEQVAQAATRGVALGAPADTQGCAA